jgi:ABC transporter ATM
MLSPGLRLALHVNSIAGHSTLGVPRKACFGSGIRYKSSLFFRKVPPLNDYRRWFQYKASTQETPPTPRNSAKQSSLSSKPDSPLKKDNDFVTKGDTPTRAEQRRSDWGITKRLLVNVWPKNDWKTRWTVLLGFGLLVSSKVSVSCLSLGRLNRLFYLYISFVQALNVQVPQIFKSIVDSLNVDIAASSTAWLLAGSLILGCTFLVHSDFHLSHLSVY